ncbi:arylsulfatase [Oceanipulchritudo coccoides]|uniref:arylsulfatase n=1 Tax=Oceanipulchritudo coccoides TaxID=2706888 RepID=UPI001EE9A17B|nr:arylsulfatase [Oceanipulchritudo coccoides]
MPVVADESAGFVDPAPPPDFQGKIAVDIRDSEPDWGPYIPKAAPEGAPNVLFILYDDTGLAAWSPYGGRIQMPTLNRLAENGLTYSQWHNTALCSPTRSTILTGRNHHLNGMSAITEGAQGYPGWSGRIPDECATVAQVLQANGFSTFWLGKNHNVAEQDVAPGAGRLEWPLQKGFDRFYGFLGGETNQWFPDLVEDNHFIEQPYGPEEGYHLSKDLADQAIRMLRNQRASNPSRPWFMWLCPGANHAPHHAPDDYIAKYKGKFDDGYESYREWVLERMISKGIMPEGTELTPLNPFPEELANKADYVRPWNELNADERKLFSRMAEVFAAFSEYTDAQVGRVIDYLEETGQLDNTLIIYAADNGTSGEGSPSGSVNENKFFNDYPDSLEENMKYLDSLGSQETYNHMPTGWAAAFSTPFKMFKRYSHSGGTCSPLVIHWPKGIKARGEIRHQYAHSVDITPTIMEAVGLEMPSVYRGVQQWPLSGKSMVYSFDADPYGPTVRERQYFAMLGTRGIWEKGWKAVALHAPLTDRGHFDDDEWELYHVEKDRSENNNLAEKYPDKLEALVAAWNTEAERNLVYPLDDRTAAKILTVERPSAEPVRTRYTYFPGTSAIPEGVAVSIRNRSYKILANVKIEEGAAGVIFAHGSRFGGHSLFIKDGKLHYVYNFLGIKPEQHFASQEALESGNYILGMEFIRTGAGEHRESIGNAKLYVNDKVVDAGEMRTQLGKFTLSGDGLCIGYDSGDAVSELYETPGRFTGGEIQSVEVVVDEAAYTDLELEMMRSLRD